MFIVSKSKLAKYMIIYYYINYKNILNVHHYQGSEIRIDYNKIYKISLDELF